MKRIALTDDFKVSKFIVSLNSTVRFEEISEEEAREVIESEEIVNVIENQQKELLLSVRFLKRLENYKKELCQPIDAILLAEFPNPYWTLTLGSAVDTKITWWRITYV